jgi:AcrR family transcriptional regulator
VNVNSHSELDLKTVPRRERERRRRKDEILQAAEHVFAAEGYHSASIERIARAAEYGTGTVYLYFKDKETLYIELLEQKIRDLIQFIEHRINKETEPLGALKELVRARMEYFDSNRAFFRIYVREGMNLGWSKHERWDRIRKIYQGYLELLARLIRAAQRKQLLRKGDPDHFAVALSGIMIQLTQEWLQSKGDHALAEQTDFVVDLFLHGAQQR